MFGTLYKIPCSKTGGDTIDILVKEFGKNIGCWRYGLDTKERKEGEPRVFQDEKGEVKLFIEGSPPAKLLFEGELFLIEKV